MNLTLRILTKDLLRLQDVVKESECYFLNDSRDYMQAYINGVGNTTTYITIVAPTNASYIKFNDLWERANVKIIEKDSRPNTLQKLIRRIKLWFK